MELVDVTYSGATTAHILTDRQNGAAPQIEAVTSDAALVTITIGGNDVGYVPSLMAASLPGWIRRLPVVGPALGASVHEHAFDQLGVSLRRVGEAVRAAAPGATVLFVDYLTLLPPAGTPATPLAEADVVRGRDTAARLEAITEAAAADVGCGVVRVAAASRDHHAWSTQPWTIGARGPLMPTFGDRPIRFHPNRAGMRAVAGLVAEQVNRAR